MNLPKTTEEAKQFILDNGIEIEPGKVLNIYACGCIIPNKDDPKKKARMGKNRYLALACPKHKERLLTKYKLCKNCGKEQTHHNLLDSECCVKCNKEFQNSKRDKTKVKTTSHLRNNYMRDDSKYNCKFRPECLEKYMEYDCIECAGCDRYEIGRGDVDPMFSRRG